MDDVISDPQSTSRLPPLSRWMRDLHLYAGLFISPFILVFSVSVFFLAHAYLPKAVGNPAGPRTVANLPLPSNLEQVSGRARIDALRPALDSAGVHGEVGWITHNTRENQLIIPVSVPGRITTVTIDVTQRSARVEALGTGLAEALVTLHKSPGPHLVGMRMNWPWMRLWGWMADATVYLIMFITVSGVYQWYLLRPQRKIGSILLAAGAFTFVALAYAIVH